MPQHFIEVKAQKVFNVLRAGLRPILGIRRNLHDLGRQVRNSMIVQSARKLGTRIFWDHPVLEIRYACCE